MGQPTWRKIAMVKVPANAANLWTPALDFVTPGKLYRIMVETKADPAVPPNPPNLAANPANPVNPPDPANEPNEAIQVDQTWLPESGKRCTADGDATTKRGGSLTLDSCLVGALIAKVGGSSADAKPDKDKTLLFAAGRHCVFSISDATKCGSLYLGVNDSAESLTKIEGQLEVTICEGL